MSRWLVRLERTIEVTEQAEITVEVEDGYSPDQTKWTAIDDAIEQAIYLDEKQWHEVDSDPQTTEVLRIERLDS